MLEFIIPFKGHMGTLLFGIAVGSGGTYFAEKYTDQRRKMELVSAERDRFKKAYSQMSTLIDEIRTDISGPDARLAREFILASRKWTFGGSDCLVYYFEDHPNLEAKIQILENHGYIVDVSRTNLKRYRMGENFVAHVTSQ